MTNPPAVTLVTALLFVAFVISIFLHIFHLHKKQGGHWGDSGWIRHKLVLEVDWQKN